MIHDVIYWLKHHSKRESLAALLIRMVYPMIWCPDAKHNEENGEHNPRMDRIYNYSWNCGAEGPKRRGKRQ